MANNDWEDAVDMRSSAVNCNRHFAYDYPRSMPDHVAIARLFIAHGAKLDALDMFGRTALHGPRQTVSPRSGACSCGRGRRRDRARFRGYGRARLREESAHGWDAERLLLKEREEQKTEL